MTDAAEDERKARAERLRKRIGNLAREAPDEARQPAPHTESGRDFVHRRMREIDREKERK